MPKANRTRVLTIADNLVNGDRDEQYGDPISDFRTTAEMWSAYLSRRLGAPVSLEPHDVAALMCCLKLARISWSYDKDDNWIDLAGYAACGWDCVVEENPSNNSADDVSSALYKAYNEIHEAESVERKR